ncbi:MAG: hypothetical protein ACJAZ8_002049, partial [Planctomycetota bacterium]
TRASPQARNPRNPQRTLPITPGCAPKFIGWGLGCPGCLFATIAVPVAPYPILGGLGFLSS